MGTNQDIKDREELQFEQAEFEQRTSEGVSCTSCSKQIGDSYYTINGQILCSLCCDKEKVHYNSSSMILRCIKASGFGFIGAAIGAGVYYAVLALTGYEVGLIAIIVGWLVGAGVNLGCEGRGGLGYQALAIILTYSAIVSTYVPMLINELRTAEYQETELSTQQTDMESDDVKPMSGSQQEHTDAESNGTMAEVPVNQPSDSKAVLLGYLVIFGFAFCVPFLAGFENIIGILIIGFALYQAWVINQRRPFEIGGPYKVGNTAEGTIAPNE